MYFALAFKKKKLLIRILGLILKTTHKKNFEKCWRIFRVRNSINFGNFLWRAEIYLEYTYIDVNMCKLNL